MKTFQSTTGHTMNVTKVTVVPDFITDYTTVYAVRNWDATGHLFMYVAKGIQRPDGLGKQEVHVFYPNGKLWSSYGKTIEDAINGAIRDGWLYAN